MAAYLRRSSGNLRVLGRGGPGLPLSHGRTEQAERPALMQFARCDSPPIQSKDPEINAATTPNAAVDLTAGRL